MKNLLTRSVNEWPSKIKPRCVAGVELRWNHTEMMGLPAPIVIQCLVYKERMLIYKDVSYLPIMPRFWHAWARA